MVTNLSNGVIGIGNVVIKGAPSTRISPNLCSFIHSLHSQYLIPKLILFEREILFVTFRKDHRLRVFQNGVLRRMLGPNREEVTEGWRKLHSETFIVCNLHQLLLRLIKGELDGWGM
jgi:hypothetical protein